LAKLAGHAGRLDDNLQSRVSRELYAGRNAMSKPVC